MEGKKVSFGFKKTKKAEKPLAEESKEFIECMEEKSIKVVGGEQVKEAVPLVIPMKPNTLITAERLKQIAEEVENAIIEPETSEKKASPTQQELPANETLDQMVVRELLHGASKEVKMETSELTVPIPSKPVVEGQKESTLDDYEDVPIQAFGLAMLRGMGWTPNKEQSKYKQPQLRPKGLGLGADKVVTENQKKKALNDKGEELAIVKNSFVKITSGKYSGYYGKVVSLDEENGRAMIDITVKKETVSLSEFMMQAVTKSEFDKESKVINADSFDAYKKNENKSVKLPKPQEREASSSFKSQESNNREKREREENASDKREREGKSTEKRDREDKATEKRDREEKTSERSKGNNSLKRDYDNSSDGRSRDKYRRNSSSSEDRSIKKKKKKRYSSNDSLSSLSDSDKKRKHKSSRRRDSSSDSDSDSPRRDERKRTAVKKRDIDKKRKGKKKKRDRDRSPHHYKKHRK